MRLTQLFISEADIESLSKWKYSVIDESITTMLLTPFWNACVACVPRECAPNALTLAGFICIVQGFAITQAYLHTYPVMAVVAASVLGFIYFTLDAIDGKHARNIRNSSPLGELFDHACDNLSLALATVQLFWIVGIYDNRLLYALTFAFSLNFFCEHLSAFDAVDRTIRFGKFTGPGEAIALWLMWQLGSVFGLMSPIYAAVVSGVKSIDAQLLQPWLHIELPWPPSGSSDESEALAAAFVGELACVAALIYFILKTVHQILGMRSEHRQTQGLLLLCFTIRLIPLFAIVAGPSGLYSFGGHPYFLSSHASTCAASAAAASAAPTMSDAASSAFTDSAATAAAAAAANGVSSASFLAGARVDETVSAAAGAAAAAAVAAAAASSQHLCAGPLASGLSGLSSSFSGGSMHAVTLGGGVSVGRVLADGIFMSVFSSDIIVAKMANREFHPLVALLTLASTLAPWVAVACTLIYYASTFWDLCSGLNLPLLTPLVNVYCDGIFDMCHVGHMKQFEQALMCTRAHRLIVGVISDEVAAPYKRLPVMNSRERYEAVRACKHVSAVIEDAPLYIPDEAFLTKHNIHLVAAGEEYVEDPTDYYFAVPRKLGILRKTKRTPSISTSDLLERVIQRGPDANSRAAPAKAVKA